MSSNLLQKARQIATSSHTKKIASIAPLACASFAANAATLNLDTMFAGYYSASGFFTEVGTTDSNFDFVSLGVQPVGTTIGGQALPDGFKLSGSSTMSDNRLGQIGTDPYANFGNEAHGLAFAWGGSVEGPLQEGDKLVFDYDFSIDMSDNLNSGSSSYYWDLHAGIFELCCGAPVLEPFAFQQTYSYSASESVYSPGLMTFQGTAEGEEFYGGFPGSEFGWQVWLTINWYDEDAYSSSASGDTLSVVIPQNSIDVGINAAPQASPVPVPAAVWLFSSGLALLAGRKRFRK